MQIGDVTDEQLDEPADTNKEGEAAVTRINSLKSVIQNNFCGELLRNGADHTSGCHRRSLYVIGDGLVDSEAQCEVIGGSRAESGSLGSRVGVEERSESGQSDKESCEQGVGSNGAATELCYLQQVEGIGAQTRPGPIVLNNLPCNADRSGEVDSSQFSQSNDGVMLGSDSTALSTQALSDCDKPDTVPDSTDPSTEQESSAPLSIEANIVQLSGSRVEGVAVDGSAVGDVALEAVAMEGPAVEGVAVEEPAVEAVAMEGPTMEGPAVEGVTVEGVAMEGPAVEGPAVQGVAMEGPAVEGVAVEGVAMEGPAVEGEAVEGPTVEGVAMEGPAVEGGAVEGPAVEGVATTYLYYPVVSAAEGGVSRVYSCRWRNCAAHFLCLEDLVIHINDDHVKLERPQVDYTCHWDGCPRRGKGFNARYKMLIHIRTHTNEKPHTCSICGKGFSRLENLKIHNRSHTGEKPYPCPFQGCHKAYSNSSDRFKHVRTHQVEKPYRCKTPGCDKRYTDPSSLRKHVRKHGHFNRGDLGPHCHQPCCGDQGLMGGDRPGLPGSASTTTTQLGNPAVSSASVISIHGNIMHISGLASNPLLSSTIVNVATPSQGGDNSTDTVQLITIPASLESPSKDSSLSVLEEPRCQEGPLDPRCQEGPLDLSTSPDITAHASDDTTDVVQCAFSVCGKWELATIGAD